MSGLFGGGDSSPPPPVPKPVAPMPDDQSPMVQEAQRRRVAAIMARGGRQSTILTDGDNLNAPDSTYSKTTLGNG